MNHTKEGPSPAFANIGETAAPWKSYKQRTKVAGPSPLLLPPAADVQDLPCLDMKVASSHHR